MLLLLLLLEVTAASPAPTPIAINGGTPRLMLLGCRLLLLVGLGLGLLSLPLVPGFLLLLLHKRHNHQAWRPYSIWASALAVHLTRTTCCHGCSAARHHTTTTAATLLATSIMAWLMSFIDEHLGWGGSWCTPTGQHKQHTRLPAPPTQAQVPNQQCPTASLGQQAAAPAAQFAAHQALQQPSTGCLVPAQSGCSLCLRAA